MPLDQESQASNLRDLNVLKGRRCVILIAGMLILMNLFGRRLD
jgi:hypothetical protein